MTRMVRPTRARLLTASMSLCLLAAAGEQMAFGQAGDAQAETAAGLDDIVVTARRREERLQDVAASVSALSAGELARRFDSDVRDFANAAPNVVIDDTQQGPGGVAAATIRGIGVADVEKSIDPAVGVVLDEIYLGTSSGNLVRAIDIDRVEVLRGPQGTLFGRNAIGGVINLSRSRPTEELTGRARLTYSSFESWDLEGLVSFGIAPGFALKFTGAYRTSDGYFFNRTLNQPGQRSDFRAFGFQMLMQPTDRLEVLVSYDDQLTKQDAPQLHNLARPTDLFCAVFGQCAQALTVPQSGDRYVSLSDASLDTKARFDMNLGIIRGRYLISDDLDLVYIYGRMRTDESILQDFDATPLTLYHTDRPATYNQDTHELRLTKSGGPFTFVLGGYLWNSQYQIDLVSYIGFVIPGVVIAIPQTVRQTTRSYAGFFEADWRFAEQWKLTVGGRYTKDRKTSGVRDANIETLDNPVRASWSRFTPKVSLSFIPNEDVLVYGLYSRGYRSGGFNGRPTTLNTAIVPYNPEIVDNFELGFKAQSADRRFRLNASAFLMKYEDKQEDVDVPAPTGTGRENQTLNAASAELKGFEIEAAARLAESFTLSGNIGYLDARYTDFFADVNSDGIPTDNTGLRLRRAPKWTYTVSGRFEQEIGPGTGWIQADLRYIGPHEITFLNNPALRNDGQYLMDASVSYQVRNTMLSVFVRNLFKEDGWSIGYDVQGLWSYGAPRPPRVFGVALTQTF